MYIKRIEAESSTTFSICDYNKKYKKTNPTYFLFKNGCPTTQTSSGVTD